MRHFRIPAVTVFVVLVAAMTQNPSFAVFPDDLQPDYERLERMIESGLSERAIQDMETFLNDRPDDADLLNLLGFANRKLGRFDLSRSYYERALAIDPNHLGALEYMGELELQMGRTDDARAIRERLAALCPEGCHELEELDQALSEAAKF